MRISSSWLTLGASLSLLIPAWTANAQEFTIPNIAPTKTTESEREIVKREIAEWKQNYSQCPVPESLLAKLAKVSALTTNKPPDQSSFSQLSPVSPTVTVVSIEPQKVNSTEEPAKVVPSSVISNSVAPSSVISTSGKLDPAQTLVVPTTPSQVKIERTKPITLNEIVELLEKSSPDWIQAKIAVDRARAVLAEAEAGRSATASSSAQYTITDSASGRLSNINNNLSNKTLSQSLSGTVGINYNIFDSGVNDSTISTAKNNLRIAEATLNQARNTIRLSITTAYYNLQNTDETIRIRCKAIENSERSLKDTKSRERAGVGTKFDVLQSEVSLANAKQDLLTADAAQQVARRELSRQINYPPTVEITAADEIKRVATWKLPLAETILLALQNRAELDIRRLEREVARDRATTSLARLGPQVSVFANLNAVTDFVGIGSLGTGYQLGAKLDWSLYDGGKAAAQVDQFKADQATAESNFEKVARQARYDVEEAYINQKSRCKQIETAMQAVKQAEEALRLARLRLDAGVGTQLEVITAESDFTRADVNRVQAIIGYNQSRANLDRAVGWIWVPPNKNAQLLQEQPESLSSKDVQPQSNKPESFCELDDKPNEKDKPNELKDKPN